MGAVFVELRQGSPGGKGGRDQGQQGIAQQGEGPNDVGGSAAGPTSPAAACHSVHILLVRPRKRPAILPLKKIMENIANSIAISPFSSHEIPPPPHYICPVA